MKPLKVSIIIPVYNAEKYIRQCVESIIEQNIGFENNIELILINDGSKDKSKEICEQYAKKYPNNVICVNQKNAGASEARNTGIAKPSCDFVGFIDADDYISKDVVSSALKYFRTAPKDVDVAICRVVQFGRKNTERPINKKFYIGTRTADLNEPGWYDIYPRIAPAFIRTSIAKKYKFKKDVRFYEDTRYISEILSKNMKLGIVDKGIYFNRMHDLSDAEASITTGATCEKRFYLDSPGKVSLYLLKKYKGRRKYPPLYFQYLAMYEMRWRMFFNPHTAEEILSPSELATYRKTNKAILNLISDEAIVDNKLYNVRHRAYLLSLKHGFDIIKESEFGDDNRLFWRNLLLFNHITKLVASLAKIRVVGDKLLLEGYFNGFIVDNMDIYLKVNQKRMDDNVVFTNEGTDLSNDASYDDDRYQRTSFVAKVPLDHHKVQRLSFGFSINNSTYSVKYIDLMPILEAQEEKLRYITSSGLIITWQGNAIWAVSEKNKLGIVFITAKVFISFMLKFSKRVLGRLRRELSRFKGLCIRMIKMLK